VPDEVEFVQLDVFADAPFKGNPLAVFPDAGELSRSQMQSIASEMNLSETSFVTDVTDDSYDIRIFTPAEELPFAGHPTIGTAWALTRLGRLHGDNVIQRSPAGVTRVRMDSERTWLERTGRAHPDLEETDPATDKAVARSLGLDEDDVGLEARELGRHGRLRPALADAGLAQLIVPVKDVGSLGRCSPVAELLRQVPGVGAYCFTAVQAGRVRARGFFPGLGVSEDPATGSAAAALGLYAADRLGAIDLEIAQGVEIGRPSRIFVRATSGRVEVGGRCELVLTGRLQELPEARAHSPER
jgi:trans-2,3-dihydro-3-hydroxyanthranilate isomerase